MLKTFIISKAKTDANEEEEEEEEEEGRNQSIAELSKNTFDEHTQDSHTKFNSEHTLSPDSI